MILDFPAELQVYIVAPTIEIGRRTARSMSLDRRYVIAGSDPDRLRGLRDASFLIAEPDLFKPEVYQEILQRCTMITIRGGGTVLTYSEGYFKASDTDVWDEEEFY